MIAKRMIAGPSGKYGGEKKASKKRKEECLWRNPCWDELRHKRAIDTVPRDFEKATASVGVALVTFGQRIHNYAMNHRLIPYAIKGKEMWPKCTIGSNPAK